MMGKVFEAVVLFDIYGRMPQFFYKGSRFQKSVFGFFMTIFLILFSVACFIYFGRDVYNRNNPEVISSERFIQFPEAMVIYPEKNPFMMEINDPLGTIYYTDFSLILPLVHQFTLTKTKNGSISTEVRYIMETCNYSHFEYLKETDESTYKYFTGFQLSNFFCLPKNIPNLTVQGTFDSPVFKFLKFSYQYCSNNTKNITG